MFKKKFLEEKTCCPSEDVPCIFIVFDQSEMMAVLSLLEW